MCGYKCLLIFFNTVFFLAGVIFVIVGSAVNFDRNAILPGNLNAIPGVIISAGCFLFIIAFFGCFSAVKESGRLLVVYAICMLVPTVLKIWLAVAIFQNLFGVLQSVLGGFVIAMILLEVGGAAFAIFMYYSMSKQPQNKDLNKI